MDRKTSTLGLILVGLGVILLLFRFDITFEVLLGAALIVAGIWMIWRRRSPGLNPSASPEGVYTYSSSSTPPGGPAADPLLVGQPPPPPPPRYSGQPPAGTPTFPQQEGGKIKYSKFVGDMFIDCQNIGLQNVEVSMFAGDVQINLRGGKLAAGLNRMIVSGFLGDVMIFVPQGMPVFVHCSGFVGDLDLLGRRSSGFGNTIDAQTAQYDSAESKLYIAINNFIGDVRVYAV